jgi:hypothetical protein
LTAGSTGAVVRSPVSLLEDDVRESTSRDDFARPL